MEALQLPLTERHRGGRLVSPRDQRKINSRANQWQLSTEPRPPACSAPCLCIQSEQAAAWTETGRAEGDEPIERRQMLG